MSTKIYMLLLLLASSTFPALAQQGQPSMETASLQSQINELKKKIEKLSNRLNDTASIARSTKKKTEYYDRRSFKKRLKKTVKSLERSGSRFAYDPCNYVHLKLPLSDLNAANIQLWVDYNYVYKVDSDGFFATSALVIERTDKDLFSGHQLECLVQGKINTPGPVTVKRFCSFVKNPSQDVYVQFYFRDQSGNSCISDKFTNLSALVAVNEIVMLRPD